MPVGNMPRWPSQVAVLTLLPRGLTNAANFGTWSVNEADKTITRLFVGALNPANEGKAETKNSVSLSGDELKLGGQSSLPSGEVRTNSVYRRVK
jgi:hypothetical protein